MEKAKNGNDVRQNKTIKILQFTDCHLGASANETLLGLRTEQSLCDVLEKIATSENDIDLLVATGDISNDGSAESYDRFLSLVYRYLPKTKLAWLDGNHDDPAGMDAITLARPIEKHLIIDNWSIVFLSSRVAGEERGELPLSELDRLADLLQKYPLHPTIIFLHHQPVPIGCEWVDGYTVSNAKDFFKVLDQYPSVKVVAWGHVHQDFRKARNDVVLLATPSTCIQFKPNCANFTVDRLMPGYRLFELHGDGNWTTEVRRISHRDYPINFVSSGY